MAHDGEALREAVEFELHEMCQPLTALRCRLDLALMLGDPEAPGALAELREAVTEGLEDVKRTFACVERMRARLRNDGE